MLPPGPGRRAHRGGEARVNNYALWQDLLPVLQKHGVQVDGVRVEKRRARFLAPANEVGPMRIVIDCREG